MRSRRRAMAIALAAVVLSIFVPVFLLARRARDADERVAAARAKLAASFDAAPTVERLDAHAAAGDLEAAIALGHDDAETGALAHLARSIEDLQAGDLVLAEGELAAARATLPPEPALDVVAAAISARQGETSAARTLVRRVLDADPADGRAALLLASLDLDVGSVDEARETLDALCDAHPDVAEAHRLHGLARERSGDGRGAESELTRAIALDGHDNAARIDLGELLRRSGRDREALAVFDAAVQLGESSAEAHLGRGLAEASLGDDAGADVDLRRAAELAPRDATPWLALGDLAQRDGRLVEAIHLYRQGLDVDATAAAGFVKLGNALVRSGLSGEAAEAFRAAIAREPDLGAAHQGLGVALLARGDTASARDELNRAIVLDPTDAHPRAALARLDRQL